MQSAKFHDVEHKDLDRKFRRLEALFHRFKQYEVRNMQPWKNDGLIKFKTKPTGATGSQAPTDGEVELTKPPVKIRTKDKL